jgi:hypothetical protein
MSSRKAAVVVTTIGEPHFLDGYVASIDKHDHTGAVDIIVIPDRKTPASVGIHCAELRDRGYSIVCPAIADQDAYLAKFPGMRERIPYDSDNRRNIGFLMALDRGAEVLISIDDDNYCLPDVDFVGEHLVAGTTAIAPEIASDDGWFNLATMLESNTVVEIYPRGFPYGARNKRRTVGIGEPRSRPVAINAGLWLTDPDVDAITRLTLAPRVESTATQSFLLDERTWSPVNTQNTGVAREAVIAYYYVRMGHALSGMTIDRYGDILSGYFAQKCAKSLGHAVRIGTPVADHRRTPHDLFKDLYHELAGMVIVEDLLPWLMELRLSGRTYADAYLALSDALAGEAQRFKGFIWDQGAREFLAATAANMRAWVNAVRAIG